MARSVPGILSFTSGELSPLLDARVDIDKYFSGCKTLENFISSVQGPAVRRPGTRYVASTKMNGQAWLGKFVFNRDQSYILEFGNNYIRFFVNRGILLNLGVPYEVATPWTYADLTTTEGTFALQFAQSGDILYIAHSSGTFRPMKLSRLGATNWTLTNVAFDKGPFKDVDGLNTITVTPSALTGNITLTASAGIFSALHVGTQMYLEVTDLGIYDAWEVGKAIAVDRTLRYNGNVYRAATAATTGSVPPTHIRGIFNDGTTGVDWEYIHSGYGIVTITGFVSATVVNATVKVGEGLGVRLPGNAANPEVVAPFTRWAFHEVSDIEGWPVAIEFAYERLCLAKSRTIYMSEVGIYESWAERTGFETNALNAIRYPVNLRNIDQIRWLSNNKDLLVGTDSFEFSIQPQTEQQVFGPDNIKARPQTAVGSKPIQPIEVENATIHVQDAGLRLRQLIYSYEIERYSSDDLSVLAEHIPGDNGGMIDMCRQRETDPIIWSVMANGLLAGTTYNRIRGVVGWHRHPLGGYSDAARTIRAKAKSCECISAPARNRDDVWLIVERYINGTTVRYVEYIEDPALLKTGQEFSFYVDAGLSYAGGSTSSIGGFMHLANEPVQVFGNGGPLGDEVIDGAGVLNTDVPVTVLAAGFGYRSILTPMRMEVPVEDGTAQTRLKSTGELSIRVKDTIGGSQGLTPDRVDPIASRPHGLPVGMPTPIFSGTRNVVSPSDINQDGFITIVQDQACPMTILGIYPRLTVND